MNTRAETHNQEHSEQLFLYAIQALPPEELSAVTNQLADCPDCRLELQTLQPVVRSLFGWSTDVLRPAESLWPRLAQRSATEAGTQPFVPARNTQPKPEWEQAAPGTHVKILATDHKTACVSMLVRLDPGTDYPGHIHRGVEELHLLHGELKVDDRTLHPGDFIHAEAGSTDHRVWSETGCTCVLMTSTNDVLL